MFAACSTQWGYRGEWGEPTGISLPACESAARALGHAWTADLLDRVQILEAEALGLQRRELARALERARTKR